MSFQELMGTVGIGAASLIVGFVSGIFPLVNTELYVVVAASVSPASAIPTIANLAALGQMLAKSLIYLIGRGAVAKGPGRRSKRLEQANAYLEKHKQGVGLFIFVSGLAGLPPLYAISIAAGGLRIHFMLFFFAGLLGRAIRFLLVGFFPQLVFGIYEVFSSGG